MAHSALILAITITFGTAPALAADTDASGTGAATDPVLVAARQAIASSDWASAQTTLQAALGSNPGNAVYHNLYAYSVRKAPNPDMNLVFQHYREALKIDPKHRAAHEYAGEAYLMVNDLPKAKEHLAALDKLCFLPCAEYSDLKKAVAAYAVTHKH